MFPIPYVVPYDLFFNFRYYQIFVEFCLKMTADQIDDAAQSKKAAKKQAKEAEKNAKKAQYKAAAAADQNTQDETPDYSSEKYGILKMIQSENKYADRFFVPVSELPKYLGKDNIWVRGRVHTSRCKGKQCFLILRQHSNTVQCVFNVNDVVSKQMVKFTGS